MNTDANLPPPKKPGLALKHLPVFSLRPADHHPKNQTLSPQLGELMESIRRHGLLIPILVRESARGYEIVDGKKRARAMRLLGHPKVPCLIVPLDDDQMRELALLATRPAPIIPPGASGSAAFME